ncbi:MAG: cytochrome c3 family protein [Prolixibacteraceae bacterium]|nr:cytochrome c3 family protein [Prolixibacteraceae bacterium]
MIRKIVGKTDLKFLSLHVFLFAFISILLLSESINAQSGDLLISEVDSVVPEETHSDSVIESVVSNGHSQSDIGRGKRLFLGILPFNRSYESCVSCHNLQPVDTLNWNPSAMDIALKYANKDFASFKQVLMEPSGVKMQASHVNFTFNDEDLNAIKTYLNDLSVTGPGVQKPSINRLLLFLFLGVLITWALLDLIFFKKIKYKFIPILIFIGAFGYQLSMLFEEAAKLGRSQGYQPDQPIKFSHKVHATDNQIDCMYCHHTATDSKTANVPSTQLCMNCHIVVREGTHSGRFEIDKLVQAHEEGRSVEWVRIHKLPDHVFFSHAQHVGAGNLDCIQCHGNVEQMHIVQQVNDLSMGWCLDCHRQTKVDFVDNDYYKTFEAFHKELASGKRDSIVAADIGANECAKCHY